MGRSVLGLAYWPRRHYCPKYEGDGAVIQIMHSDAHSADNYEALTPRNL